MFLGCFFLVACVSLRCETSIHPGSALFRLCQGICNIWFLLLQVRKKMCRVSGSLVGCSFSTSVERGMMISDSLPVRLRVSAQELLSLLVLADPLWVLFVALHCWEELEVRASELINEGEFTERWVKSQLSSLLKMHCWGVLYLGTRLLRKEGHSTANNSLPGGGRAYGVKLLPNAGLVVWDIVKFTNFIGWSTIGRKRWLVIEVAFCQNL